MRIAFCVYRVPWQSIPLIEFYGQDWRALEQVADSVVYINHPAQLRGRFDAAVVWWWNHLWLWGPVLRARGIPILAVGVYDVDSFAALPWYKRVLKRGGIRFAALHAMISRYEVSRAPALGFPAARLRYAPCAVDGQVYRPRPDGRGDPPVVLNIGWHQRSNIARKMVVELLEAFASLPPEFDRARLVLAGRHGDGDEYLKRRARELGVEERVDFPGEVSREAKLELLHSSSLYCQVSHYEGFGLATAEALACGVPVLVSRVGAVPEVIQNDGMYVDEISVAGIRRGLAHCLSNLPACREGALRGAARIRREFSSDRRREDFRALLKELRTETEF